MRRYVAADEEKIRMQALVREWEQSGLLDDPQARKMDAELRVELRRTNGILRGVFFFFTAVVVSASVLLLFNGLSIRGDASSAAAFLVSAIACWGAAEYLVGGYGLYHYGIEEAFAAGAVVLLALAASSVAPSHLTGGDFPVRAGLAVAALAAWAVYQRFGYLYAAVASLACAAVLPLATDWPEAARRACSAALLLASFVLARRNRLRWGDHLRGDDYAILQAAAWTGLYLALNLQLGAHTRISGPFYWFTYAAIWILPAAGLYAGLRHKERALMAINLVLALLTLATNKPYLGLERQAWDPILLGILLVGIAVVLRRWLARGAGGQRRGFTPVRILASEDRMLAAVGTASAAFQPQPPAPAPSAAAPKPEFGGGSSGGGGATSNF